MKPFFAFLLALTMTATLAGCVDGPPSSLPPGLSFDNYQTIDVNAAKVEVVNNYKPSMRDPYIEHTFRTTPYAATEQLLKRQLVAAGTENTLRATIEDASVTREELPVQKGFTDIFVREPSEKLKARVLVRFELVSPTAPDIVLGHADVVAKRERTLLEDLSPAERDQTYFMLTKDLMDDLNDGMRSSVRNTLGRK